MTPTLLRSDFIRRLNDEFRRLGPCLGRYKFDGLWIVSGGVQAEGACFTWSAIDGVMGFNAFSADGDPAGEHDCGSFAINGEPVFWVIDYLQRGTPFAAADPSDNAATVRIVTIMLAEEM